LLQVKASRRDYLTVQSVPNGSIWKGRFSLRGPDALSTMAF